MSLNKEINELKTALIAVAEKHQLNLLHPEVIRYSEKLDLLIVKSMASRVRAAG